MLKGFIVENLCELFWKCEREKCWKNKLFEINFEKNMKT
jgi:hypothetical protein